MKKFDLLKTIQLIVLIVLTVVCALIVFLNRDLFHIIASDQDVKLMCTMLWIAMGLSFLFIFFDFTLFSGFKKDYRELDYAVHSDPATGMANRTSSDALIEKYLDKPLPANMGCIMFELANIKETNKLYGHIQGNLLIRDFATILRISSVELCFVARNGGNKFLALFESGGAPAIETFLERVESKVRVHNSDIDNHPVEYNYGIAFNEGDKVSDITELIALSNRRISN